MVWECGDEGREVVVEGGWRGGREGGGDGRERWGGRRGVGRAGEGGEESGGEGEGGGDEGTRVGEGWGAERCEVVVIVVGLPFRVVCIRLDPPIRCYPVWFGFFRSLDHPLPPVGVQRRDDPRDSTLLADPVLPLLLDPRPDAIPNGKVYPLEPVLEGEVVPRVFVDGARGGRGRMRVRDEEGDLELWLSGGELGEEGAE